MTAAVVYFLLILPMNKFNERRNAGKEKEPTPPTELELLGEIRDLLAARSAGAASGTIPAPAAPADAATPTDAGGPKAGGSKNAD
jgi:large conductance mechanosensitive channel